MNNYFKNFGIWMGGALVLAYAMGISGFGFQYMGRVFMIVGIIVAIVQTHKAEARRIEFGKAFGAMAIILGGFTVLWIGIMFARVEGIELRWVLGPILLDVIIDYLTATSILLAAGQWYMFEKAGKPGWGMIIPIYNIIVWCQIAKKPEWWVALLLVPIVNIVFLVMIYNGISKNFGKTEGFTVGLVFLGNIFMAILGYGDAKYLGERESDPEILDA